VWLHGSSTTHVLVADKEFNPHLTAKSIAQTRPILPVVGVVRGRTKGRSPQKFVAYLVVCALRGAKHCCSLKVKIFGLIQDFGLAALLLQADVNTHQTTVDKSTVIFAALLCWSNMQIGLLLLIVALAFSFLLLSHFPLNVLCSILVPCFAII